MQPLNFFPCSKRSWHWNLRRRR